MMNGQEINMLGYILSYPKMEIYYMLENPNKLDVDCMSIFGSPVNPRV